MLSLFVSAYAVYQAHEANSPRVVISPLAEHSLAVCNTSIGLWQTMSVVRFSVSNVGGRTATLEHLLPMSEMPAVLVRTDHQVRPPTRFTLVQLLRPADLASGLPPPIWDLAPLFDAAAPVLTDGDARRDRIASPPLNVLIEAGKAVTLDLGLTTPYYDESDRRVTSATVLLRATFAHGESSVLRTTVAMPSPMFSGTRCDR